MFLKDDKCQKSVLRIGLIAIIKRPVHKYLKSKLHLEGDFKASLVLSGVPFLNAIQINQSNDHI